MFNYTPYLKELLEYIKEYGELPKDNAIDFTSICISLYENRNNLDNVQIESLSYVLKICNLIYENTNFVMIDDDFYDQLIEVYRQYNATFEIGAENINFSTPKKKMLIYTNEVERDNKHPLVYINVDRDNMLFYDKLTYHPKLTREDCISQQYDMNESMSKRIVNSKQNYPELVGTLDKCKFVLNQQAIDKGVFNEDNVKVFERDFLFKHLYSGIIDQHNVYKMIAELKYDGVSISGEIVNGDTILSAKTRGDVNEGISADLTPIFKGYKFHHALHDESYPIFGMKFEAVITKTNLYKYNQMKNRNYANGRTAIIGILSSSDAHLYRDLITLIPLQTSGLIPNTYSRQVEIELLNKCYRAPEINKYAIIEGDYLSILFQVKKFVEEAELMRDYSNYMYDGVVISYDDPNIRQLLGRENSVNKYSMAIKFSALKKQTKFLGYSFTVGQDGTITPMIHYNPVVFFGTVHDKASGHSYARFKELGLRINDMVDVEYTNDVMAYVTKPDNSYNKSNESINQLFKFPTHCPCCGTELIVSESGKNIKCPNLNCEERSIKRIDSMFKKLNIKDFSDASIKQIAKYHLLDLLKLKKEDVSFLGEVNSQKFIEAMNEIMTSEIYDYKVMGALGFTNVATEKWKTILKQYNLAEIINMILVNQGHEILKNTIANIKGIGPETANIISNEFDFFKEDIMLIMYMDNIKSIKEDLANLNIKKIRFTGCRDSELINFLSNKGHDITGGGITKDTNILLIPHKNYTSTKTNKVIASRANTMIVPIDDFKSNMDYYLNL